MNLHNFWLTSEVASKIGIASSNFSQLAKNSKFASSFKKAGNMLFVKFDKEAFDKGHIVFRDGIDSKIAKIVSQLTVWDNKYPTAAFVEDANISFAHIKNLASIEGGKYLEIKKTEDGKGYLQFKGVLLEAIKNGYSFYNINDTDLEELKRDNGIKGHIVIKKNVNFVWY